jgi:hypothetical protein
VDFSDIKIESATTLVAAIWPLSEPACPAIPGFSQSHSVLPLKTYIQETLKRSKTRFSTLQVALYYLVLLKEVMPSCNFTMEQPDNNPYRIALQCGRRMFLTALMLASKYLQDRNYSAKAWSKITGLQVKEINLNEVAFLLAIDWKLHVQETTFERWQNILIKYSNVNMKPYWGAAVMGLKPDLTTSNGFQALITPPPSPPYMEPLVVMPPPEAMVSFRPADMRPMPMSETLDICSSPAASSASRSAMCAAMSIAALSSSQRHFLDAGMVNKSVDYPVQPSLALDTSFTFTLNKFSSSPPSDSSPTSPGSMISDHSSQSSRSSSISLGSSNSPPLQTTLLQRATKNARNYRGKIIDHHRFNEVTVLSSTWDENSSSSGSITASPEVYVELYDEPSPSPSLPSRKRPIRQDSSYDVSHDLAMDDVRSVCDYSDLQQEVRGLLRTLPEDSKQLPLGRYPLPGLTASKRACVDAVAFGSSYVDMKTPHITRPSTGPGMWQGIL